MTDEAAETECVEEFLQRAEFWRSIAAWLRNSSTNPVPGACEEELKDCARRTIYWAMQNARYDMTRQDFGNPSRWEVLLTLTDAILLVNNNSPERRKVVSRDAQVERSAAQEDAQLAIVAADLTWRANCGNTTLYSALIRHFQTYQTDCARNRFNCGCKTVWQRSNEDLAGVSILRLLRCLSR